MDIRTPPISPRAADGAGPDGGQADCPFKHITKAISKILQSSLLREGADQVEAMLEEFYRGISESSDVRKLFNKKVLTPLIETDKDTFNTICMEYGQKIEVAESEFEEQKTACLESKGLALELIQGLLGPEIGEQLVGPLEEAYSVVAEKAQELLRATKELLEQVTEMKPIEIAEGFINYKAPPVLAQTTPGEFEEWFDLPAILEDIKGVATPEKRGSFTKGGAGEIDEDSQSNASLYGEYGYHLQRIPKIIPIEEIERATYRFVEGHTLWFSHPYAAPNDIPDTVQFPMSYTGIMLRDKPHCMGLLELKDVPREDPSYSQYKSYFKFKLYGQFVDGELHGGPVLIQQDYGDWVYVTNYIRGKGYGELLTFRKKNYPARTPASPSRDTDTSGALEIAGPIHKTLWHNDPEKEPKKSKLFFTRGDIFEGIFYKYAMKEGIMHKLQSDGSYKRYQQKYDAERDAESKCLVKNQVPIENTPLD